MVDLIYLVMLVLGMVYVLLLLRRKCYLTSPHFILSTAIVVQMLLLLFGGVEYDYVGSVKSATIYFVGIFIAVLSCEVGMKIAKRSALMAEYKYYAGTVYICILFTLISIVGVVGLLAYSLPYILSMNFNGLRVALVDGDLTGTWNAYVQMFTYLALWVPLMLVPHKKYVDSYLYKVLLTTSCVVMTAFSVSYAGRWPFMLFIMSIMCVIDVDMNKKNVLKLGACFCTFVLLFSTLHYIRSAAIAEKKDYSRGGVALSEPLNLLNIHAPLLLSNYLNSHSYITQGPIHYGVYMDEIEPSRRGILFFGLLMRQVKIIDPYERSDESISINMPFQRANDKYKVVWATGFREIFHDFGFVFGFILVAIGSYFVGYLYVSKRKSRGWVANIVYFMLFSMFIWLPFTGPILHTNFHFITNLLVVTILPMYMLQTFCAKNERRPNITTLN